MDLKEIMSVSGYSGLFKFVSQGRNGIIVESFSDHKRMFVNATQKVSSLADIAIFTEGSEVPLKDVLKKIHELQPGQQAPDPKSDVSELKKFMEQVLPEYDRNRVYVSDIKKLVTWYNALLSLDLLKFEEEEKPAESAETSESPSEGSENSETPESKTTEASGSKHQSPESPKSPKSPKSSKSPKSPKSPKTPKKS